jgi:hypothetical protein
MFSWWRLIQQQHMDLTRFGGHLDTWDHESCGRSPCCRDPQRLSVSLDILDLMTTASA